MKTRPLSLSSMLILMQGVVMAAEPQATEATQAAKPAGEQKTTLAAHWLPAGMAPANDPARVAALHDASQRQRVEALRATGTEPSKTDQDRYAEEVADYRRALVQEQLRKEAEQQQREHERAMARQEAELALQMQIEKQREDARIRREAIHAHQRWLNEQYELELEWRRLRNAHSTCEPHPHKPHPVTTSHCSTTTPAQAIP